uniref:Uncharacterized protein n=1 Tax=Anguilla anguilla TaxID=7936 RepID=A0A0E9W9X2_ANGAN
MCTLALMNLTVIATELFSMTYCTCWYLVWFHEKIFFNGKKFVLCFFSFFCQRFTARYYRSYHCYVSGYTKQCCYMCMSIYVNYIVLLSEKVY